MAECSFALVGGDYVLIASDATAARSIVKMKSNEDKMKVLSSHMVMAYSGEPGDTVQFAEFVERNVRLQHMRSHAPPRPHPTSSWIRKSLADSLRSRNPYSVNLLLAGYDLPTSSPHLYWIDYLGTKATLKYAAHGYASYFALSCWDNLWQENMDKEEGIEVLKKGIAEVKKRLAVDLGDIKCRLVDADGVHDIELGEISL